MGKICEVKSMYVDGKGEDTPYVVINDIFHAMKTSVPTMNQWLKPRIEFHGFQERREYNIFKMKLPDRDGENRRKRTVAVCHLPAAIVLINGKQGTHAGLIKHGKFTEDDIFEQTKEFALIAGLHRDSLPIREELDGVDRKTIKDKLGSEVKFYDAWIERYIDNYVPCRDLLIHARWKKAHENAQDSPARIPAEYISPDYVRSAVAWAACCYSPKVMPDTQRAHFNKIKKRVGFVPRRWKNEPLPKCRDMVDALVHMS